MKVAYREVSAFGNRVVSRSLRGRCSRALGHYTELAIELMRRIAGDEWFRRPFIRGVISWMYCVRSWLEKDGQR